MGVITGDEEKNVIKEEAEKNPGGVAVESPRPAPPNCYQCKHRRELLGTVHSQCAHPFTTTAKNSMDSVMAIFASVGRVAPVIDVEAAQKLNIKANAHGIRRGWFNWPYNFDPTWLQSCDGFEAKTAKEAVSKDRDGEC